MQFRELLVQNSRLQPHSKGHPLTIFRYRDVTPLTTPQPATLGCQDPSFSLRSSQHGSVRGAASLSTVPESVGESSNRLSSMLRCCSAAEQMRYACAHNACHIYTACQQTAVLRQPAAARQHAQASALALRCGAKCDAAHRALLSAPLRPLCSTAGLHPAHKRRLQCASTHECMTRSLLLEFAD